MDVKLSIDQLKSIIHNARLDRRKKNLIGDCPQCGENEFGISLDTNHQFGCFRKNKCGYVGNIFTLIKDLKRYDLLSINQVITNIAKLENKIRLNYAEEELDLTLPKVMLPIGWKRIYEDEYMASRGFTEFETFKVGRTMIDPLFRKNYVIFPIEEVGECKGYVGRHIKEKKEIDKLNDQYKEQGLNRRVLRYRNSTTDFGKLLYSYEHIIPGKTKTIIAVEGMFDVFNVVRKLDLFNQDEIKCNGTFKCDTSAEQKYKWKAAGIENLILMYDPDVVNQIKKNALELENDFDVYVAYTNCSNDPGDMTLEELGQALETMQRPSEFKLNTVNIRKLGI